jgi:MraZ protein
MWVIVGKSGKRVNNMFIGEYNYNLDEKGRLSIPTVYKQEIGEKAVVARGLEQCLYIYTMTEWEKLVNKISDLSFTKKSHREFSRMFLSGAYQSEIDTKGRINIDSNLISHAGLKKECTIIGSGNRIEIWDKELWNNYYQEHEQIIEDISEELDL